VPYVRKLTGDVGADDTVGEVVGTFVGDTDGVRVGAFVGDTDGVRVGAFVGDTDGERVGAFVGNIDGACVGTFVGLTVGPEVGTAVSSKKSKSAKLNEAPGASLSKGPLMVRLMKTISHVVRSHS